MSQKDLFQIPSLLLILVKHHIAQPPLERLWVHRHSSRLLVASALRVDVKHRSSDDQEDRDDPSPSRDRQTKILMSVDY